MLPFEGKGKNHKFRTPAGSRGGLLGNLKYPESEEMMKHSIKKKHNSATNDQPTQSSIIAVLEKSSIFDGRN